MKQYQGHNGAVDKPERGGSYVDEQGRAHECCNFLAVKNSLVHGHVETWQGELDAQIGKGWLGESALFYPKKHPDNEELPLIIKELWKQIRVRGFSTKPLRKKMQQILTFDAKFYGETTAYRDSERKMKRFHGKVANALYLRLVDEEEGVNIYSNQIIDITATKKGHLEKIYEVKTKSDRQSIYTGIGQLMFHSGAKSKIKKILVLPQSDENYEELSKVLGDMGISVHSR